MKVAPRNKVSSLYISIRKHQARTHKSYKTYGSNLMDENGIVAINLRYILEHNRKSPQNLEKNYLVRIGQ